MTRSLLVAAAVTAALLCACDGKYRLAAGCGAVAIGTALAPRRTPWLMEAPDRADDEAGIEAVRRTGREAWAQFHGRQEGGRDD
jgi:hypothetical protein